jgi:hypothetical protein
MGPKAGLGRGGKEKGIPSQSRIELRPGHYTDWAIRSVLTHIINLTNWDSIFMQASLDWYAIFLGIFYGLEWRLNNLNHFNKVKVKLSLRLTKHHAMKTYWGVEVQLHACLTSALDGDEWSASRPGRLTPRKRAPGIHWIGGWVGPRAVLGTMVKRKFPSPRGKLNPRTPIVQPVAQHYIDWAIMALSWDLYTTKYECVLKSAM